MPLARFVPPPLPPDDDDVSADVWGFRDTRFSILPNGSVMLTGARYGISGLELPGVLPFMRESLGVAIPVDDTHAPAFPPAVQAPVEHAAFSAAVRALLPAHAISADPLARLRRGHGHTLEAMYGIKYGSSTNTVARVPDLVVAPGTVEDVTALVALAAKHGVCLVPYGGGTNVTDALRCPPDETRMIVSVDLRRMDRILWIDPENRMACIQAGAVGRRIRAQLESYGFTMGHEPDSVEFSTLGGWIATNASGMKKNRYGNIEDLVLDAHVVTATGALARPTALPRESVGIDPRKLIFGSEGTMGIVTHAVVKLFALPDVQRYDALAFPTFESGFAFLHALTHEGPVPASVRLVDNLQLQFSQMLKPRASGFAAVTRSLERWFITAVKGFDPTQMVACTLVYEGTRAQVAAEETVVRRLARAHGGVSAGAETGRKGYELTFGIAYFRDFILNHHIVGESLETSVSWSDALALCAKVKQRLASEFAARKLPGKPFITCRITQLYQTGVAVYFYFGFYHKGVDRPDAVYTALEHAARDEILKCGGALSHHHGIGKVRRDFLPRVFSKTSLDWAGAVKRAIDPDNIFGIANQ